MMKLRIGSMAVALLLTLLAVMPAYADDAGVAMGRYTEQALSYPGTNFRWFTQRDGKTYAVSLDADSLEVSGDLTDWKQLSTGHDEKNNPVNGDLRGFGVDEKGRLYLLGWVQTGKSYGTMLERIDGGKPERANLEIPDTMDQTLSSMEVLPDGGIIASNMQSILRFSPEGEMLVQYQNTADAEFTVSAKAGEIATWTYDSKTVAILDLEGGRQKRELQLPATPGDAMLLKYDDGGALYLACSEGIYRVNAGGTLWEQIADGKLTTLGKPSAYPTALLFDAAGNPAIVYSDDQQGMSLVAYRFDETVPAEPTDALNVLTLYDSQTIRQAASKFQAEHPEVMVNITVALPEDTAITRDDAIRTLNTELMAGKGPDVLVLDGLPLKDYVEKGILADLSDAVKPMIDGGQLLCGVAGAFEEDGAVCAVPARFLMPTIWGEVGGLNSLDDLAAWAKANPDTMPFYGSDPEKLIGTFYLSSAPAWFDENGRLREDAIAAFLTALKDIRGKWTYDEETKATGVDTKARGVPAFSWNPYEAVTGLSSLEENFGLMMLVQGSQAFLPYLLRGPDSTIMPNGAITGVGKGNFRLLPGQAANTYVPKLVLGAPKDGARVDLAKQFIKTVLGNEIQTADLGDGFPVSVRALDAAQSREESTAGMIGFSGGSSKASFTSQWPNQSMRDALRKVIDALTTPVVPDFTLYRMMVEESAPFFEGQIDAQQAASNVVNKANAYLSE